MKLPLQKRMQGEHLLQSASFNCATAVASGSAKSELHRQISGPRWRAYWLRLFPVSEMTRDGINASREIDQHKNADGRKNKKSEQHTGYDGLAVIAVYPSACIRKLPKTATDCSSRTNEPDGSAKAICRFASLRPARKLALGSNAAATAGYSGLANH